LTIFRTWGEGISLFEDWSGFMASMRFAGFIMNCKTETEKEKTTWVWEEH
jgi:hypothetical protein